MSGSGGTSLTSSRDGEDLAAFFDLERRLLDLLSTRVAPSPFGVGYLDDEFPTRHYSNFLLVDRGLDDASADRLIQEADRVLADRAHLRIVIRDEGVGAALGPTFAQRGLEASHDVVMVHRRSPDRPGALPVAQRTFDDVASLILETYRQEGTSPALADHFTQQHGKFERVIGARFFTASVAGEPTGLCELHGDATDAMVENVFTLERARGHGVARSVVLRAIEVARGEGARRVFIVTDDDDWPKELYTRLGFDRIGRELVFTKVAP
jgi:GNAT superfamily N-acetyltransferase